MNKTEFIKELSLKINMSIDDCTIINDILENNFFISKKNKDKIIDEFQNKLSLTYEQADDIYNTAVSIITKEIKSKLKHPFRSID